MEKEKIDLSRRRFLRYATGAFAAVGALFASIPFLASWLPSARARAAGAPVEVDLSRLEPGEMMTVEWRGRPVWLIRRTQEMIDQLAKPNVKLRDSESRVQQQPTYATNPHRSIKKEYLILVGICTHLGCSPTYMPAIGSLGSDWPGGFYCPCHGSTFDLAGRVYTGVPAPINLEVPPHHYVADYKVIIGENSKNA
ncbi:MAG: ubiquinol-cytochrome c reductase iron-sulfur subunit [Pseudomonadota bacterium]